MENERRKEVAWQLFLLDSASGLTDGRSATYRVLHAVRTIQREATFLAMFPPVLKEIDSNPATVAELVEFVSDLVQESMGKKVRL